MLAFESSILGGISLLLCFFVFYRSVPIQFGLIPLLFWATVRYGDRGAATVAGAITVLATIATSRGYGPFVMASVNESLLLLQSFIGVMTIPSLFLAGVLAERKQAAVVLQRSEANLQAILAAATDGFLAIDNDRNILHTNKRFAEIWRIPQEIIETKNDNDCIRAVLAQIVDPENFLAKVESLYGSDQDSQDIIQLKGNRMIERFSTPLWDDGSIRGRLWTFRDITERKRTEDALCISEAKYRDIVENAPMGIFRRDVEGKFQYVNPCLIQQLECKTEKDLLDNYGLISQRWTRPERSDEYKELLLKNRRVYGYENECRLVDGTTKWFALYGFLDDSDQFINGFSLDITARKHAEDKLRKELERSAVLVYLFEQAHQLSDRELYACALEHAVRLTDSTIGFFHLISPDQQNVILSTWNSEALKTCTASYDTHYQLEKAGNWVDCIRLKQPVIYNDFPNSPNRKGLPEGHAPVRRFMSIPVIVDGRAEIIFGVGNKSCEYDERDQVNIQLVANELHKIILQRRSEKALQMSERKARSIFDLSFGFIGLLTCEGILIEANRSALEFAGIQLPDVVGRPFWETPWWCHSTDMQERIRAAVQTAAAGELVRFEATHPAADGTLRNIDVSVKPVKDGAGRVVFLIPEGRDITEVKQKTDALRENERRLSSLMENLFGMVFRCKNDKDWTMEFLSAGCSELTGYGPEDILHNNKVSYNDLIHPEDQQRVWDEIQAALSRKEHYILEYRIRTASGKEKWVWEQGSGVFSQDGEVLALEGFISDSTDRKQADEERARLVTAINQSDETVVITDREGTIQYVNPAFERITGYTAQEAIGQNPRVLKSGHHTDAFYTSLWATISGAEAWKGHLINRKKDGSMYEEEATISPVKDASGKIINYVAVKRDVTQELQLEKQIRQAQKMEAIGTLAGGIAHDFNNILGGIMGYTELAMGEPAGSTKTAGYLSEALKSADRARTLVKQILTFSRRTDQESKPLQPNLIIKEACKLLRASLPSTIELRQRLYGSGTLIMGDPTHIYQIVMNLCTNAHHAMRERGGVLDVGLQPVDLAPEDLPQYPGLQQEGAYLKLSVSDTGCGISQAHLDRIFDPYFTTKEKGEGTGLGLSVVDGIVKGLGGAIKVTSEEGRGTTFDVLFPRLIAKIAASPEEGAAQPLPRGKETILFVDDEEVLRFTGAQMLHQLGYRVVLAANAAEALEIFLDKRDSIDLVITDKTMPKMTGFELARAIKNLRPDIPIVLCTGYSETEDMAVAEAIGISQFVMKPLRKKALAETVRQVLDRGNAANG
jgi:PAS domain S-box-containing protein